MDEKDRSKSPIREEILMISEDNKYRISMDPEEKESSEQSNEGEEKEEKKIRIVGIRELFRYAAPLDVLMIFTGIVSGTIHGVCLLFLFIVFGSTLDEFVDYVAADFCDSSLNITTNCTDQDAARDELIDHINHPIIFYYCLIGVISLMCGWLQVTMFQLSAERQIKKIRTLFFRAILKQEISWFDLNPTGELNSRLNDDLEKVATGIGDKLAFIFQALGTFFGGLVVGFVYVWQLALLMIGCAPVIMLLGGLVQRLVTKLTAREQAQYAGAGAIAEEVIGSIRTVAAFGGQEKEVERYAKNLKDAKKVGIRKAVISGLGFGINFLVLFGILGLAYWFSGYLISNISGVSTGDVLITFFVLVMGAQYVGQAVPNVQDLATARGAAGVLYDIIDREPEMRSDQSEEGLKPEKFDSDLKLTDVDFFYPSRPSVRVLSDFSISVSPGQTLALVGPSGCGKSTVVQLIQRFYDVANGQVKVGGYDVRELNLHWLRQHIGVVSQEPVLFATTIAENIRYGRDGVTQEEIESAAKAANAHSFISELPDGYNTLVGERGTQLSGGQKQRVAIARALVRDPKILLLDEATSALDSESEAIVQAALDKARQGRTTVVVAHRLSTIQGADIIAAIADGRVAEVGTHSQLLRMNGVYYDLVTAQSYGEVGDVGDQIVSEMMKKYTKQLSEQDEGIKAEHQIIRQYSRQQSNPDATTAAPAVVKKQKDKEAEEEAKELAEYSLADVLWRLLYLNSPELHFLILGFIFSMISGMIFPAYSIFFGEIIEDFSSTEDAEENARFWSVLMAGLGAVAGSALLLRSWCFGIAGESLTMRFRKRSFRTMLRQDMNWFDQTKNATGKLTSRLSLDAAQVQGAVGIQLGLAVEIIVTVFVSLVIAFVYSWSLTLLVLGFMPLLAITQAFQGRVSAGIAASSKKGYEESSNIAYEAIANIRTVASLGLEDKMGNLFVEKIHGPHKKSMRSAVFVGFMAGLAGGLIYFMYAILFRFGAFVVSSDDDNIAHTSYRNFITVLTVLVMAGVQAGRISTFLPNYSKATLSARRIFKLLDTVPQIDNYSTEGLEPEMVDGGLSLEKLYFTYPSRPNMPVLQGLSISISAGQTLALVGPSGCGKSTVISLLERFYDPDKGVLRFDGQNLKSLNIQWLRRQMGLVSQEPVLFDASIADNIRYGANHREVSDEEVEKAAKSANIHDFVLTLPQGYSTNVGSKGTQLSGGQKQRVAIARALVRDPKILLLDEATSALDSESEQIVQEALDNARKGRTTIVIAHRLSTIHNANCIAVVKDGVVIEAGTHSQLMEWKGAYYKLNKAQMLMKD